MPPWALGVVAGPLGVVAGGVAEEEVEEAPARVVTASALTMPAKVPTLAVSATVRIFELERDVRAVAAVVVATPGAAAAVQFVLGGGITGVGAVTASVTFVPAGGTAGGWAGLFESSAMVSYLRIEELSLALRLMVSFRRWRRGRRSWCWWLMGWRPTWSRSWISTTSCLPSLPRWWGSSSLRYWSR